MDVIFAHALVHAHHIFLKFPSRTYDCLRMRRSTCEAAGTRADGSGSGSEEVN